MSRRLAHRGTARQLPGTFFATIMLILHLLTPSPAAADLSRNVSRSNVSAGALGGAWPWHAAKLDDDALPRPVVFVGEPADGLSRIEVEAAIRASIESWNGVSCSYARLQWGGFQAATEDVPPTSTAVLFTDATEDDCFPDPHGVGFTVFACDGYGPNTVLLNLNDLSWAMEPAPFHDVSGDDPLIVDLESAVTHELGHVLGLSHDEDDLLATMSPRYLRDGGLSSLAASDKLRVCELYPTGESECADDDDCDPFGACRDEDGLRVCEEERGALGEYCARDHLVCPQTCYVTSEATHTGYCTETCESDEDCPDNFVCGDTDQERACLLAVLAPDEGCSTASGRAQRPSGPLAVLAVLVCLLGMVSRRRVR